ncbi:MULTISPECIES: tripartite tricarboxylate transporter substrate binding protein [Pseudacidovorax]|uniref:Bug family tripartite tricarboxylate transporter substrate binding protein n=1 Tax=Pseudacidovorax TaxID=433923 RepID=UPI001AFEA18B|nr:MULTISPECIES: tripartite tricarboxylate transporter substrate binding protein [Pseudacidovorax]MBO9646266.1 tripartite tricarboxylate transporter substrate binding protein [Pseudacidovorax sp.]
MRSISRRAVLSALAFSTLTGAAGIAAAADWPSKPITLIVPFAAGGTNDILARIVGQKLSTQLGVPVVVDNRGGAGGTLGAGIAARATPDGNTFLMAAIAHAVAPALYKSLPYDFGRDFDPIGLIGTTPNVLIVNPSVPAKTVPELIAYAKANPGKLNYGSAGPGSTEHLAGELFRAITKTDITHVPYKGGAPMMADLLAGNIQMALETSPSASPHIKANKVRALAVTSATRSPIFPNLPPLAEAGVPGYEMTTWFALMAPHNTPAAVQERMQKELRTALANPEVKTRFAEQGVTAGNMTPAEVRSFVQHETQRWGDSLRSAGVKPE